MRSYLTLLLIMLPTPLIANTLATPAKPIIGINASEMAKRVCYYQDQAYSDGAVIQVGDYYMSCSAANPREKNGPLKWHNLQQSETPANSERKSGAGKRYSVN